MTVASVIKESTIKAKKTGTKSSKILLPIKRIRAEREEGGEGRREGG
jgi:hypothetical protein